MCYPTTSMASLATAVYFLCRHLPVLGFPGPPELHEFIINHIRNDRAVLNACDLSRPRSQACLFRSFVLRF